MKPFILVLDKDGVIVESEPIKLASFEQLFEHYPHHKQAIHQYNHRTIGVPRKEKLRYVGEEILGLGQVEEKVEEWYITSQQILKDQVLEAPLLPGVQNFLNHFSHQKCYVCSAAPLPEVESQISHHHLTSYFERLYGFPSEKHLVLKNLVEYHQLPLVFFGDTLRDYKASIQAQVGFIGVNHSTAYNQFEGMNIPLIQDFVDINVIQGMIESFI